MTSTVPRVVESQSEATATRSRGPLIAFIVLALAAAGIGAWLLYDQSTSSDSAVPAEIQELIDDYLQAWEQLDADGFRALVTLDFAVNEYWYENAADRVFMIEHVADTVEGVVNTGLNPQRQWTTEQVGERIIAGDGPWFVSVGENWILDSYRGDGMATYVIVEDGGVLKIANHYWTGLNTRTLELTP